MLALYIIGVILGTLGMIAIGVLVVSAYKYEDRLTNEKTKPNKNNKK